MNGRVFFLRPIKTYLYCLRAGGSGVRDSARGIAFSMTLSVREFIYMYIIYT